MAPPRSIIKASFTKSNKKSNKNKVAYKSKPKPKPKRIPKNKKGGCPYCN